MKVLHLFNLGKLQGTQVIIINLDKILQVMEVNNLLLHNVTQVLLMQIKRVWGLHYQGEEHQATKDQRIF